MTTIEDLPGEVMYILFSHLSFADRKNVRLVNKHWFYLADCMNYAKDIDLVFQNLLLVSPCAIGRRYIPVNIRIDDMRTRPQTLKFWEIYGSCVKSLELFRVNLESSTLYDVINLCPNLEHLLLSCDDEFDDSPSSSHESLKYIKTNGILSLHLMCSKIITEAIVLGLTTFLTKLKRFGISIMHENDSDSYAVETMLSFIERQSGTLKELCFDNCPFVNGEFLNSIPEQLKPQLTGLLVPYGNFANDDFFAIIQRFPNLEKLDVSDNRFLAGSNFSQVLYLKRLKLLSFRGTNLSDNDLSAVAQLEHLSGLDLTKCGRLTANGIIGALGQKQLPKLIELRLIRLGSVTDNALTLILPQMPNLKRLFVENCNVTDRGVPEIFKNCKLLEYLSLAKLSRVTLNSFVGIKDLKCLKHLNLQSCGSLDVNSLSNLEMLELQTINLRYNCLSAEAVNALVVNWPSLRRVSLECSEAVPSKIGNCLISSSGVKLVNIAFPKNVFDRFCYRVKSCSIETWPVM